jgi:predicted nucleic acid-binding Zn ribbon protein
MLPIGGGQPHCKQCGYEIERGESICPQCQYSPRQRGLKVSLWLLMGVVISMSALMMVPSIGRLLIGVGGSAFALAFLVLLVSFVATPYRLGSLFLRL